MATVITNSTSLAADPGPASQRRRGFRKVARRLPGYLCVTVLLVVVVYPLVWLLLGSLKTQDEFLNDPTYSLPHSFTYFSNYSTAWSAVAGYLRNSVLAVFPALGLVILLGTAAGFALEVLVWRGRGATLLLFLAGIMIPGQMILLPLFTVYFKLGLTGTLWPLIITYTAIGLPLTVFMMATYFRAIPREVFEAATLDGATVIRSFFSIAFPMMRNSILTIALVQFFFLWNDLLIALTFTTDDTKRTVQVGLLNFTGQFGVVQYGPTFAAICINVLLILVLYVVLNQRVMRGLSAGAVKG
ncbi:raffinose/stachyose/melibiose transport system permease protein [Motilibacter peucedani]|uniref:Raffinose/stachyose/melibiose transport system permease protein n=1 Tax=Motilibacter peucedani TaxID=598650 RepID=A0A420XQH7_9ACTN|nr:carbohydrate ABC transporter permease [Motilibacter peucedani]RKS75472.1 raffinose/stachyose/melibiose transport system permease protein [Motilibacter peucedani]